VRGEEEILATLDDQGTLDALPFMPEMRRYCGGRYQVKARADRTFAEHAGLRRMRDAVHLSDVRCDGSAHDGCGRSCLMFWKEAWLERCAQVAEADTPIAPATVAGPTSLSTRRGARYFCQATELAHATRPIRISELRQFLDLLFR